MNQNFVVDREVNCENEVQESDFAYDTYGEDSRCFNTNLTRSVCMKSSCNNTTRKIESSLRDIAANFVCEFDGQEIYVNAAQLNLPFIFYCPNLTHFCPE